MLFAAADSCLVEHIFLAILNNATPYLTNDISDAYLYSLTLKFMNFAIAVFIPTIIDAFFNESNLSLWQDTNLMI